MSLRDQLQTIYAQHDQLTPELVVRTATPKRHPLHDRFEWDDKVAGPKYRLIQARELIQSVTITRKDAKGNDEIGRAFYARPTTLGDRSNAYDPADVIAEDPFLAKLHANQMEREWQALRAKWEAFPGFLAMVRGDVAKERKAA